MRQLILTAITLATITVPAWAKINTEGDTRIPAGRPKVTQMVCNPADTALIVKCAASYSDGAVKVWWLKEVDGVVYRYAEYPTAKSVPVPFD